MGIHRINKLFLEEFNSPGDLRFRIETDIRMPRGASGQAFVKRLRAALDSSRDEAARDLLLKQLERPVGKGKGKGKRVTQADLIQVRRLVTGALSDPGKELPRMQRRRKRRR